MLSSRFCSKRTRQNGADSINKRPMHLFDGVHERCAALTNGCRVCEIIVDDVGDGRRRAQQ